MKFKDYYQTLGVAKDATADDIKRAYRKLARKYHPDVSKEADAEARFKEVGEAYEVLKDPEKRAAYDQFGKDWKAGQEFRPPPDWDVNFEYAGDGAGEHAFSDFFETLFGRMGGARARPDFRSRRPRMRGEDHHARIQVSLREAYEGSTKTLTLRSPQASPDGHVATATHSIRVSIPKGVKEGQRIRLAGQGAPGFGGGPPGDLYLEVGLEPHPFFAADGRDIHLSLPVTPWEAALGATVPVPTLGGTVDLKIPAGTQSGNKLRLKGRGLPGSPPGDQIVTLRIETPVADSQASREFYERMRDQMPMNPRKHLGV
jgi:curved DNA-binding protein